MVGGFMCKFLLGNNGKGTSIGGKLREICERASKHLHLDTLQTLSKTRESVKKSFKETS